MIGATVWNLPDDRVKVVVWDDDGERKIVFVNATDLPKVINTYKPDEIWKDGEQVELCFNKPSCHELILVTNPSPFCPDCNEEYERKQREERLMRNQIRYAGVIG